MNDHTSRLLTIITETAIEHLLVQDIERLGAHGYTVSDARGKGSKDPEGNGARNGRLAEKLLALGVDRLLSK